MYHPKYPSLQSKGLLWADYFEKNKSMKKAMKTLQVALLQGNFIFEETLCQQESYTRDHYFTWETYPHGRATFLYQTLFLLTFAKIAFPRSLSFLYLRMVYKLQSLGCLLNLYLCGAPIHTYVINFFLLFSFIYYKGFSARNLEM